MATHSDDRSLYFLSAAEIDDQLSNIEEKKKDAGSQFIRCIPAGALCKICVQRRKPAVQEVRPPSALISRQRKAHVGVSCDLLLVSSRRYCVITVLTRGIAP